ncbi:MAG TPA: amino acid synthesis family protein [Dehalococcoidia bacterium]|nr:amino acid synthesis family protein [Dehalococcoidia bacterium]
MLDIRKVVLYLEEVRTEGGRADDDGPLCKVAALAVIRNPYAGRPWSESLDDLVAPSGELANLLAERALGMLGGKVDSYGKGAIVGLAGEQEHANACLTSVFGDAFREAVGGAAAWLPSVTKRAGAGAPMDIPVAYRQALWVRSYYDAITVSVPDAPLPDEILVGLAVTNRGRINARLGGLAKADVKGEDGLR